jgi:ubiquinone/menaquinone biosynthesis C-methylase UbiE
MSNIFNKNSEKYDSWYERNKFAYLSELKLLSKLVPKGKKGLEIGVGTGRFAEPLGIKYGIDPSENMLNLARQRGIIVKKAFGEDIPFNGDTFDYAAIIITLAFVSNPEAVIKEAYRVLNSKGRIIIGIVDSDSFLADYYRNKEGVFYKNARFIEVKQLTDWLKTSGFINPFYHQTLFHLPKDVKEVEEPKDGFGQGGFVVVTADKK